MPRVKPKDTHSTSKSSGTWDEVADLEEAAWLDGEIVDFLRDSKRFARLGARVPGVLLLPASAPGKTRLASCSRPRSELRFNHRERSPFNRWSPASGQPHRKGLSEDARKSAPAIVFIDELVSGDQHSARLQPRQDPTLNQLLVELRRLPRREQVIVMAASNRLQGLDLALLRPGRFDRQVLVSPPDT